MSTKALSNQEIFDTVVTHLRQQGMAAAETTGCRYRTADGLSCAVGCLIDGADYSADIEGLVVNDIDPRILWNSGIGPGQLDLLVTLQLCHDASSDVAELLCNLMKAAHESNLSHGLVDDWHLEATPEELGRVWRVA